MAYPIQPQYRYQIRQQIGRLLGCMITGAATSTVDTTSLIDAVTFARPGGDDEYNGWQVCIYDATGSIVDGSVGWVTDFAASTYDATTSAFSATITTGDKFELWKQPYTVEDINAAINQAIIKASADALQEKQSTLFTTANKYEYDCLSSYEGIYQVEYCYFTDIKENIHSCDSLWNGTIDTDVTATLDTSFQREGLGCNKFVVGAGASANDVLALSYLGGSNVSNCDAIELWIYSSVALSAGDIIFQMRQGAPETVYESLNIPATSANTWTRHTISLANPYRDTNITTIGLEMEVDKGAFTLYVDDVKAVHTKSRKFKVLNPDMWYISRASTPLLGLTSSAKSLVGDSVCIRLSGYELPALINDEATTASEVDPAYLVEAVTADLMLSNAKASFLDIENRDDLGELHLMAAQRLKTRMRTPMRPDTRMVK